MASDIDYDRFDYHSRQDYNQLEYQIDLFEFRYTCKNAKQSKRKLKQSFCSISTKNLKSNPGLLRVKCLPDEKTIKAGEKQFRYTHHPTSKCSQLFECDDKSPSKPIDTTSNHSDSNDDQDREDFASFRQKFYARHRPRIKAALRECPSAKIANIRFAPVDPFVQNQFMNNLHTRSSASPKLVFHGTKLANINSILRFGFLVPGEAHPKTSEAPVITSVNGQAYGNGIYCSTTASFSFSYMHTTNTLLVCAALPRRNKPNLRRAPPANIIVLPKVEQIIPLFLVDIQYTDSSQINRPWYSHVRNTTPIVEGEKLAKKPVVLSRKYLRKILAVINDEKRKNDRYQVRTYESFYSE